MTLPSTLLLFIAFAAIGTAGEETPDVRGFPPDTEVRDPYSKRVWLVQRDGTAKLLESKIANEEKGILIVAYSPWILKETEHEKALAPPENQQSKQSRRKIHIVLPREHFLSLEDAMNQEMDHIDARQHATPSYGNGRRSFIKADPFRTDSGIVGLRASFGNRDRGEIFYEINKYYFMHRDGSIFKVCAHIYGTRSFADDCDEIIKKGLKYDK